MFTSGLVYYFRMSSKDLLLSGCLSCMTKVTWGRPDLCLCYFRGNTTEHWSFASSLVIVRVSINTVEQGITLILETSKSPTSSVFVHWLFSTNWHSSNSLPRQTPSKTRNGDGHTSNTFKNVLNKTKSSRLSRDSQKGWCTKHSFIKLYDLPKASKTRPELQTDD